MKVVFAFIILFPVFGVRGQSAFEMKIAAAAKQLTCSQPSEQFPMSLNATLVTDKDSMAVIVKGLLASGWHIYAYVSPSQPYIQTENILQLPSNVQAVGSWQKPEPILSSGEPGVMLYENDVLFIHKMVVPSGNSGGSIRAGLYYQTCNLRQCLPPEEKLFDLQFRN